MGTKDQIDTIRRILPLLESGDVLFVRRDLNPLDDRTHADFVTELRKMVDATLTDQKTN